METIVITDIREIEASSIQDEIPQMEKEVYQRRCLNSILETEYALLKPYYDAKEEAKALEHLEQLKKKKDRKEILIPEIPNISSDLKEDLRRFVFEEISKIELERKYLCSKAYSRLDEKMLNQSLANIEKIKKKRINLQETLRRTQDKRFPQSGDIIDYGTYSIPITKISYLSSKNGKWKMEVFHKSVYHGFNQDSDEGRIFRRETHKLSSFEDFVDKIPQKHIKTCVISYVDAKKYTVKFKKRVYHKQYIAFHPNPESNWKYDVSQQWEDYRKEHNLIQTSITNLQIQS